MAKQKLDVSRITKDADQNVLLKIRRSYSADTYDDYEESTDEKTRDAEKRLLAYIRLGNKALAEQAVKQAHSAGFTSIPVGTLSADPLRQARYTIVSACTLFSRTAIDSGLPEQLAFNMSDSYIRKADESTEENEIYALFFTAFKDYCDAVQRWRLRKCRREIRTCIEYIENHLQHKISMQELSDACFLSPNYISDLFLKELGMRPTAYIRLAKLRYACFLLKNFPNPVLEISELLAFPSSSAFSRQFKEQFGVTPHRYRILHTPEDDFFPETDG